MIRVTGLKPPLALLIVALAFLVPEPGQGATFSRPLEDHLGSMEEGEHVSVICFMADQAPMDQLNESLKWQGATRQERHEQVVRALHEATASQQDLLALLASRRQSGEVLGYTSHWIANLVIVEATKAFILGLADRSDIEFIEPNFEPALIEPVEEPKQPAAQSRGIGVTPGLRAVRADRAWFELGATGYGRLVANLDTGVDGHHEALAGRWRGNWHPWQECWLDVEGGGATFPEDAAGHGTHSMGIECGLGVPTADTVGVAWNALWIASNGMNQNVGPEFDNDVIAALQWFADPDGDPGTADDVPDVLENSWGVSEYDPGYYDCDSRWWAAIDNCEAAGVVTIWSAGNSGPPPRTIISPADRITTPLNTISVGAVDATSYGWPYPIASWSSRGPSGCDGVTIKPELVGPGARAYSSSGGGYGEWSGTSFSAPYVSGTVALMREVNPDLDVDTIKQILLDTARDLGSVGEENTYGWGIVDAYGAVLSALGDHGTLTGMVGNGSNGGTPIARAAVEVEEIVRCGFTRAGGAYTLALPPGTYTVTTRHPHFASQTYYDVEIAVGQTTTLDFSLLDTAAPEFVVSSDRRCSDDLGGPYRVEASIEDDSAIDHVTLSYRLDGGAYMSVPMLPGEAQAYAGEIPGQAMGTHIEYYVEAVDAATNTSVDPPGAPAELCEFRILPHLDLFADDMESGQGAWTHGPIHGQYDQWHLSTHRNHTSGGTTSWKFGHTAVGAYYYGNQDAVLASQPIELHHDSYLHYWQWIAAEDSPGSDFAYDGGLVEISVDGGAWEQIYPDGGYPYRRMGYPTYEPPPGTCMFSGQRDWHEEHFSLGAFEGTAHIRFRFCSDSEIGAEGWYVDDVYVDGFLLEFAAVEEGTQPRLVLHAADPNPCARSTLLRYGLPEATDVVLRICDPAGRVVRTLTTGFQEPGIYAVPWDGRDTGARALASGVYFVNLTAGQATLSRKVILIR